MPLDTQQQPVGDPVPDWSPRPLPVPTLLHGRHVRLEPLGPEHVPALLAHVCSPDDEPLWTYRSVDRPRSEEDLLSLVLAEVEHPTTQTFAVCPQGGDARGLVSLMRPDPASGVVEIGGVLHARPVQRTPATTETVHLLLRHAFDDLGYRRVEWKCDSLNEPSRAAARRLGFTYEGRFRQHLVMKGRNRDTDWFAVVDRDWPAVRRALEAWLGPDNFDQAGRQRVALGTLTSPLLA
ncbi:GNAT family N-acetyltransferase [Nocardioides marmoribigeumensis]|uniref:RimJ/RimL family protein N-acetyltransferase n=1 Tax=Nocardioides marmoribigeumensis TaxID=433649 RepID=A0ABU2C0Y4_9ACTN|nr:GNAT family protein [Nocardioides marmoribigeumensis]MDR7364323.1 RimJ/RimL family protein N-acetyltransferase [Nocardioides marmoribigeumensis]